MPEKIEELECLRCDHKWFPRSQEKPQRCPRCKSKLWDVKKVRAWEKDKHTIKKGR